MDNLNTSVVKVLFEPGAKNNWHTHPGGQMLVVTKGIGYYQEKGKLILLLLKQNDCAISILDTTLLYTTAGADFALTINGNRLIRIVY